MFIIGHNHLTIHRYKVVSSPDIGRPERRRFGGVVPIVMKSELDKNCVRQCIQVEIDNSDQYGTLFSIPSFNELFSGIAVNKSNSRLLGPVFENKCVDFLSSEVYSIDGVFLGTVESIRERTVEMV
jgi:metallophosphoesterase superfamily enzyme